MSGIVTGIVDRLFSRFALEGMGDSFDYRKYLEQKGIGEGFLSLGCVYKDIHVSLSLSVWISRYISFFDELIYGLGLLQRPMDG